MPQLVVIPFPTFSKQMFYPEHSPSLKNIHDCRSDQLFLNGPVKVTSFRCFPSLWKKRWTTVDSFLAALFLLFQKRLLFISLPQSSAAQFLLSDTLASVSVVPGDGLLCGRWPADSAQQVWGPAAGGDGQVLPGWDGAGHRLGSSATLCPQVRGKVFWHITKSICVRL